ncbi:hypothetical protein [Deinococcus marmoris]|uniref:hypothetical protein n=1 Tax=Deinococcus marmoris TaxID=249408 RepID=UPI0012DED0D4|nr:hypothetical protein [Deinococcus marmoris]
MKLSKWGAFACGLMLLGAGTAAGGRVGETRVFYSDIPVLRWVGIVEGDGQSVETMMGFFCRNGKFTAILTTETTLLSSAQHALQNATGRAPNVTYQVDAQQPKTLPSQPVVDAGSRDPDLTKLAFDAARDAILLEAFTNATTQVFMRVLRTEAAPLEYTFQVAGFKQAVQAVNACKG